MARRQTYVNSKYYQQPDSAYARSSGWATRYYNRKTGGTIVASMSGLNVTDDDFSKKEGESPKIDNARLNGSKETRKRAQSMSRLGQRFNGAPAGSESLTEGVLGDEWIDITEHRSIRFTTKSTGRLTSVGLRLKLKTKSTKTNAQFVVILRDPETHKELCRAMRSVKEIKNEQHWFRLIRTIDGDFELELTLVDDMNNTGAPLNTVVQVNASGRANHEWAEHGVPNLDHALREKPYEYQLGMNRPVVSTKTTTWRSWEGWIQNGYFVKGNSRYIIIPVINGQGQKEVYCQKYVDVKTDDKFELKRNQEIRLLIPANKIDQRSPSIRMAQAGGDLFFVDHYSPLQQINLKDWSIKHSAPTGVDMLGFIPKTFYYKNSLIWHNNQFQRAKADFTAKESFEQNDWNAEGTQSLTAWPGASLIYFLNNRLFLGGFRNVPIGTANRAEPNLVIMSSIDSVAPKYDMFNRQFEFFYVPDRSPDATSSSPVTAFSSIGDSLVVFMADGLVFEQVTANVEYGGISQVTPEGASYGTLKQEHVVKGRNNIYFYNPTHGVMRQGGSVADVISRPVDAIMKSLTEPDINKLYMSLHKDMLRLYYADKANQNDSCLIDYTQYARQKSYWYHDTNTPIAMAFSDSAHDIELGVGSEWPCVVEIENSLADFDCAIEYVYYTKYLSTPNKLDGIIARRIHVTTLQDFHSSIYIGLDYDHSNKPIVWRKFVTTADRGQFLAEDVFGDDEEVGVTTLTARVLTTDSHFCQVRVKQYCHSYQAEVLRIGIEYGNRTNL